MSESEKPRRRRRIRTEPAPGSDPHPGKEPSLGAEDELDEQVESAKESKESLKEWYQRQKPPHWG